MARVLHTFVKRKWTLCAIALIVPLGFYTKLYAGPASEWVNNSLGGILYVLFWCLVFSFVFNKAKSGSIVLIVFTATCALEFLQLWHPPLLESIRATFLGATLLGNSFTWWDLLHYCIGALLALVVLNMLRSQEESKA
jgi:hypothetical protein